jgi:hypothetical protein
MIDVRLEADNHWLRYARLAPRSLRQLRNPAFNAVDVRNSQVVIELRYRETFQGHR